MSSSPNFTKKANALDKYNKEREEEILYCAENPSYFIENYVNVQHPLKGRVPFVMYPYQKQMVEDFSKHTRVIAMAGRQLGKSVHANSSIKHNDDTIKISSLIKLNFIDRLVEKIESWIVALALKK